MSHFIHSIRLIKIKSPTCQQHHHDLCGRRTSRRKRPAQDNRFPASLIIPGATRTSVDIRSQLRSLECGYFKFTRHSPS
eukprot:scaffold4927_cov139-Amphora_coffeaeformis.AAC.8